MKKNGFTLIELLVTMGIIAVLTGLAIFNFNQSRIRARDVQRKNDLGQLQKALELYRNDNNGKYPGGSSMADVQSGLLASDYTKVIFVDPKGSDWSDYGYLAADDNKSYHLMTCLENRADSARADESLCALFPVAAEACVCGAANTGMMYILSSP